MRVAAGLIQRVAVALASVGGVGYCPVASGTAGSAVTLAVYLALPLQPAAQAGLIAVVTVLGVWASSQLARVQGDPDPSAAVIDEAAGMLIACFMVPKEPGLLVAAFLLFRLFDIGKWPPMKQLERLPGGWGIMADDVAAGLLARGVLALWV